MSTLRSKQFVGQLKYQTELATEQEFEIRDVRCAEKHSSCAVKTPPPTITLWHVKLLDDQLGDIIRDGFADIVKPDDNDSLN